MVCYFWFTQHGAPSPSPSPSFTYLSLAYSTLAAGNIHTHKWDRRTQSKSCPVCYATFHLSGLVYTDTFSHQESGNELANERRCNWQKRGKGIGYILFWEGADKAIFCNKTYLAWSQRLWRYLDVAWVVRRCIGGASSYSSQTDRAVRRWCPWGRACRCSPGWSPVGCSWRSGCSPRRPPSFWGIAGGTEWWQMKFRKRRWKRRGV